MSLVLDWSIDLEGFFRDTVLNTVLPKVIIIFVVILILIGLLKSKALSFFLFQSCKQGCIVWVMLIAAVIFIVCKCIL